MGKTYIDTVKYQVYANVEIDGLVEKPDVVGAIFGQTEGLLGDELDLRELQKNGRIGRIEVDLSPRGGKAVGKIKLPSSLDMVETSILAAALETVDRVGPCDARINIEKIEDTRTLKRKGLVDRAKNLLKTMLVDEIPESKEISEQVRSEVKTAEISSYGPEKLPAGPGVMKMDSIVVVEGRADVLNLLKNDITNAVAVGGANVAQSISKLTKEKETTAFLDGDRGGDIILAELTRICDIDFVARAPRGKEVEELTRKELIKCLRSKVPYEQGGVNTSASNIASISGPGPAPSSNGASNGNGSYSSGGESREYRQNSSPSGRFESYPPRQSDNGYVGRQSSSSSSRPSYSRGERYSARPSSSRGSYSRGPAGASPSMPPIAEPTPLENAPTSAPEPVQIRVSQEPAPTEVPAELMSSLGELENTLKARFYDASNSMTKEVPVRDMIKTLEAESQVNAIVFDGIITQRLADLASAKGSRVLVGIKLGNVFKKPSGVLLYTKQ
ncbi:MAG: DNA primase DnaG [Candidatus Micrarchaeia archaeon]